VDRDDRALAVALCEEALELHRHGALQEAAAAYRRSLAYRPLAEAHTGLGWVLAALGCIDEAIAECERAIALAPDRGQPYHDIGTYLVAKGDPDAAVAWFERAKRAACWDARMQAFLRLGEIYAARGWLVGALREFRGALALAPADARAARAVRTVERRLH
jgi:tetratricopeptide (TPR) repeat protein